MKNFRNQFEYRLTLKKYLSSKIKLMSINKEFIIGNCFHTKDNQDIPNRNDVVYHYFLL